MSTPATGPRHPWETLLDEITGQLHVAQGFGTEDDAKRGEWDRMIWVPGAPSFKGCNFSVDGRNVTQLICVEHEVSIHGDSPLTVIQRAAVLTGVIDLIAGPPEGAVESNPPRPGYAIRSAGKPIRGGTTDAQGWTLNMIVELRDFVTSYELNPVVVRHVTVTVTANATPDNSVAAGAKTWSST